MDRPRRGVRFPPIAVLFALLAVLLSIVAAAHPAVQASRGGAAVITLIVDRGLTMSARGERDLRFREVFDRAEAELRAKFPDASVDLLVVPGGPSERSDLLGCKQLIDQTPPTAIDTTDILALTIERRQKETADAIIVISDKAVAATSNRVVEIPPERSIEDVGIVSCTARERPKPEVMVRVRNQSAQITADLVVDGGSIPIRQKIKLPPRGQSSDYFVDVPQPGEVISARLEASDDLPANNQAWLVREGTSAKIEVHAGLFPELRRFIDVYSRARPASSSKRIDVVDELSKLNPNSPGVVIAPVGEALASDRVTIKSHPVTDQVDWTKLPGAIRAAQSPPNGWTSLVSLDSRVLVAVRSDGPRQVWVGFDADGWPTTTDFVIFWANVFDWVGGGGQSYSSRPLNEWSPEWHSIQPLKSLEGLWPGIYRRADGRTRAFNCQEFSVAAPSPVDWRKRLSDLSAGTKSRDISAGFLVCAMGCMVICATAWRRPAQTAQFPPISMPEAHQAHA